MLKVGDFVRCGNLEGFVERLIDKNVLRKCTIVEIFEVMRKILKFSTFWPDFQVKRVLMRRCSLWTRVISKLLKRMVVIVTCSLHDVGTTYSELGQVRRLLLAIIVHL